jgi:hypothetical protein
MPVGKNPWPYQYAIVKLEDCFIDESYQRPTLPHWITNIVEHFDPKLVGTIVVSQRKQGRNAVIDGQQRKLALEQLGFETVPAIVHVGLSVQAEAKLLATLNTWRKDVQPWHRYRALRVARDKEVIAVDKLLAAQSLQMGSSASPEDQIACPDTLLAIYRSDNDVVRSNALTGPVVLERTMEAIRLAWRGTTITWPQGKSSAMIRGVARWVSVNPNIPAKALALALKTTEPAVIQQGAKQLQSGGAGSGKGRKIEAVIETLYKKHGELSYRKAA